MENVTRTLERIEEAAEKVGLPELVRAADVPYSTAAEWRAKGWRPKSIQILEKLSQASEAALTQESAA